MMSPGGAARTCRSGAALRFVTVSLLTPALLAPLFITGYRDETWDKVDSCHIFCCLTAKRRRHKQSEGIFVFWVVFFFNALPFLLYIPLAACSKKNNNNNGQSVVTVTRLMPDATLCALAVYRKASSSTGSPGFVFFMALGPKFGPWHYNCASERQR